MGCGGEDGFVGSIGKGYRVGGGMGWRVEGG